MAAGSVREALAQGAATLSRAGVDAPRLDAELLLAEAMGVGRERLVLEARAVLPARTRSRYDELLAAGWPASRSRTSSGGGRSGG